MTIHKVCASRLNAVESPRFSIHMPWSLNTHAMECLSVVGLIFVDPTMDLLTLELSLPRCSTHSTAPTGVKIRTVAFENHSFVSQISLVKLQKQTLIFFLHLHLHLLYQKLLPLDSVVAPLLLQVTLRTSPGSAAASTDIPVKTTVVTVVTVTTRSLLSSSQTPKSNDADLVSLAATGDIATARAKAAGARHVV